MYLAIGIILLVAGVLLVGGIAFSAVYMMKKRRALVISKTNFIYLVPAFVFMYLLLLAASGYAGSKLDALYCLGLLAKTFQTLTFELDTSLLQPVCSAYPVYYVALVLGLIAGAASVILSVASLFSRRIANFYSVRRRLRSGCDVLFGDCEDSLRFMNNTSGCVLVAPDISSARLSDLLGMGYAVLPCGANVEKLAKKLRGQMHNVILFRSAKFPYSEAIALFSKLKAAGCDIILNIEAEQDEISIIRDKFIAEAESEGDCVTVSCFNRYETMARSLMAEYPITKYIPRDFYNDNFTVKDDKQINVVFVGFGKVNYQLFRMFAVQYQFASQSGDKLAIKPVNYYVIDSSGRALNNELFSYIQYEYDRAFGAADFPKPDNACNIQLMNCDINSLEARKLFVRLTEKNSFTYFAVSLSDDLRDASYAQTILRMFPENDNFRILVRARGQNSEKLESDKDERVIYFGNESVIYSHEGLLYDEISEYARRLNLLYEKIDSRTPAWLAKIKELPAERRDGALSESVRKAEHRAYMRARWEERPYIEQDSNICHSLNMPFKIYMLGFGLAKGAPESGHRAATPEDFRRIYANRGRDCGYADTSCFFGTQPANVMAFVEHARWTAMYMLHGYRQMKKSMMHVKEEKEGDIVKRSVPHKNVALKLHACITSYYGLRELIAFKFSLLYPGEDFEKVDSCDARLCELYKIYEYDYMGLDGLYSDLSAMGYTLTLPEKE